MRLNAAKLATYRGEKISPTEGVGGQVGMRYKW